MARVLVLMSGGVDSSLTAARLLQQGYQVAGCTLILHTKARENQSFGDDAQRVAQQLGIEHIRLDLFDQFKSWVIDPFIEAYQSGLTPNPCFSCNPRVKFGYMLEWAHTYGYDLLATGHYARIDKTTGVPRLSRAVDPTKDQSYFLANVPLDAWRSVLFPLGEMQKTQVRDEAGKLGLVVAERPESQDICFVDSGDYRTVVAQSSPPGEMVDTAGQVLGQHQGITHYTIGQRRGIGLANGPWFVIRLEPAFNRVVVGRHDELLVRGVLAESFNQLATITAPESVLVQYRSRQRPVPGRVEFQNDGCRVWFNTPQYGVSPGQAVVIYSNDQVLGGGIITKTCA